MFNFQVWRMEDVEFKIWIIYLEAEINLLCFQFSLVFYNVQTTEILRLKFLLQVDSYVYLLATKRFSQICYLAFEIIYQVAGSQIDGRFSTSTLNRCHFWSSMNYVGSQLTISSSMSLVSYATRITCKLIFIKELC